MRGELEVRLHGTAVGTLGVDAHGVGVLRLSSSYRDRFERPVLGQKFEDDLTRSYKGKKRGNLPPFFANLIPERGELRPLLEHQLGVEANNDFALIEVLGRDLPGAVEVVSLESDSQRSEPPRLASDDSIGPTAPQARDGENFRFSLAGVQLKFSVILAQDRLTLPAHGVLGGWLVKLDSVRFPGLCENEYSIMRWAKTAGFDVPEALLMPADALVGTLADHADEAARVLVIRRYDRNGTKIHQEDFAQVVNLMPEHKYDHVSYEKLCVLTRNIVDEAGCDEFLSRLAFVIASGNGDAHLKNWSLLYPDRIQAQLSPLYDQVSTVAWLEPKLALGFAGTKDMTQIDMDALRRFADGAGLEPDRVVARFEQAFDKVAAAWLLISKSSDWSLPRAHGESLREHWARVPILRDSAFARL